MGTYSVNKTGEDYPSFTSFESSINTGTLTVIETAELYADDGALDDRVTVSGGTSSVSAYIHLTSAAEDRIDGYAYDATKARIEPTTTGDVINSDDQYSRVSYLQVKPNTGAASIAIRIGDDTQAYYNLVDGQESTNVAGVFSSKIGTLEIYRNIIWGCKLAGYGAIRMSGVSGTYNSYHNTIYNSDYGLRNTASGTFNSNGDAVFDCTNFWSGTFSGDYNGTSAASGAPGANSVHSLTASTEFTSVTGGSEDFKVTNAGSLYNSGNDPGSPYNVDLEGDSWSTGSIGADEYVAAGAAALPFRMRY